MEINGLGLKKLMTLVPCFLVILIITMTASSSHSASPAWKPQKNVELIVGTSAGSGSDLLARRIQMLWQEKGLVKPSVTVVNKPGGGQTIAMNYLNEHAGDGHYLMMVSATFLTNQITGLSPTGYTDFTPLAVIGTEPITYAVRTDSPIKTGKDLIEQLKKDPRSLSIGIATARGNHNHIAVGLVMKKIGGDVKNLKIVVFDSSAKGMIALMGGHIDLVTISAGSILQHIQTGKVRAIAIASKERLWGEIAGIPTWREQGLDVLISDIKGMMGPKGMSQAQIDYWDDVLGKFVQMDEWKKYEKEDFSVSFYQNSKESRKFFEGQYSQFKSVLTDLGLAK